MEDQPVTFTKVRLAHGWLGNMSPHPVEAEGRTWRTTEALFQALRFPEGSLVRELIWAEKSPMAAKMVAKGHAAAMVVEPRSGADLLNMNWVLRLKLFHHPDLLTALLATGCAPIIEDVTQRPHGTALFWGAALQADGTWVGDNNLGRLWMGIREAYR